MREAQVAAGAPGALARIEAPSVGVTWAGSAGHSARERSRALRPDDAFRAASVTKSVTAAVAVRLAHEGRLALDAPLADLLDPELLERWRALRRRSPPVYSIPISRPNRNGQALECASLHVQSMVFRFWMTVLTVR